MAIGATGVRAESATHRQPLDPRRIRSLSRGVRVLERRDAAWALYLLERDFFGWPLDARPRSGSSRRTPE
jgi:hypothetical protein